MDAPADQLEERAGACILILPEDWPRDSEEPVYLTTAQSLLKLFAQKGIPAQSLSDLSASTALRDERTLDWIAPTLFVSTLLLAENPAAISLAMSVIANYATDLFKGVKKDPSVKVTMVQTAPKGKGARKVRYEGPVSGLEQLPKVLREFRAEE
jgi:hypothetical protein